MFKRSIVVLVFILAVVSIGTAQDAKTVINNASKAMGYDQLKSIEYSGPAGKSIGITCESRVPFSKTSAPNRFGTAGRGTACTYMSYSEGMSL